MISLGLVGAEVAVPHSFRFVLCAVRCASQQPPDFDSNGGQWQPSFILLHPTVTFLTMFCSIVVLFHYSIVPLFYLPRPCLITFPCFPSLDY